jgi:dTDP-4-dehydrorhamnose 3,5-epimerase
VSGGDGTGPILAADERVTVRGAPLDGVLVLSPRVFRDERGFFLETFRKELFARLGVDVELVQDNHSRSVKGTIRALHFQTPPGQAKLVRCARGSVWDVAVDLRRSSPTFGRWWGIDLSDENHLQVFVPPGFAHGFCVTSEVADVVYRCGAYYDAQAERGIAWDSPELAIAWPTDAPLLSERDRANPAFSQYRGPWYP